MKTILGQAMMMSSCLLALSAGLQAAPDAEPGDKPVAAKAESTPAEAEKQADKPGVVSAVVGGREVSVTAPDTAATINVTGPKAEVRVGAQLLVVERNQLTLDGKLLGELPADARKVEVVLAKGTLSVKADGKEVARSKVGGEAGVQ